MFPAGLLLISYLFKILSNNVTKEVLPLVPVTPISFTLFISLNNSMSVIILIPLDDAILRIS